MPLTMSESQTGGERLKVHTIIDSECKHAASLPYRNGQPNTLDPDSKFIWRFTAVLVRKILHELGEVHFMLVLLSPEVTETLQKD